MKQSVKKLIHSHTVSMGVGMALVAILILGIPSLWAQNTGRTLVDSSGQIQINTTLQNNIEYVRASQVVDYFAGNWEHNPVLGTLQITRSDGQQVGLFVGDPRIVVNERLILTGHPPVRQNGDILIPFATVYSHLFPNVSFEESQTQISQGPIEPTPTTSLYIFGTPTPIPQRVSPSGPTTSTPTPSAFLPSTDFQTMQPRIVVIDPGHNASNPGATAPDGQKEHELTMAIADKLMEQFKNTRLINVHLTRKPGQNQALTEKERASLANSLDADLFLSIHCGAMNTDEISRATVYFMNDFKDVTLSREKQVWAATYRLTAWHEGYKSAISQSRRLANHINRQLVSLYGITNIIQIDSNPRPGRFHTLRGVAMPSVLIELGNIKHPRTISFLSQESRQDDIAQYLGDAIRTFLFEQSSG